MVTHAPIDANAHLINPQWIATYLDTLFGYVEWEDRMINLRALGEKGTEREGEFRENIWLRPGHEDLVRSVTAHCHRWGMYGIGSFILPGILSANTDISKGAKEHDVIQFTTMLVDLDTGDTNEKLAWVEHYLGKACMLVGSGGVTEAGTPKYHAYWRLSEPTEEVQKLAQYRGLLAAKIGGDAAAFSKIPQVIRIPGGIHCKNANYRTVQLLRCEPSDKELAELFEKIDEMPSMPGLAPVTQQTMSFKGADKPSVAQLMTSEIAAGGGDNNRWSVFNQVAGHNIRQAREGNISIQEAQNLTYGWMHANMRPPWDDQRFSQEFVALLNRDTAEKGPIADRPMETKPLLAADSQPMTEVDSFYSWAAHRWAHGPRPQRQFLVEGLVMASQPHVLAAEGGVGKTFMMLDLAIKVASHGVDDAEQRWLGQPLLPGAIDKSVVVITAEDDITELKIRLHDIDPGRRFQMAQNRLIILPLQNAGGAFPLIQRDKNGIAGPSPRWTQLFSILSRMPNLGLVIIDTLSSVLHGEDVQMSVIQEFYREAHRVCGELGAALICTHHFRKRGKDPIRTLSDAAQAVRGSSALPASNRAILAIWDAYNARRRLLAMGLNPMTEQLYDFGIVKGNNPDLLRGTKSLLRLQSGALGDVTEKDLLHEGGWRHEDLAWMALAVGEASAARFPFCKSGQNGLETARAMQLPPALRSMSRNERRSLADYMVSEGLLVQGGLADAPKKTDYLDVPGGPVDQGQGALRQGTWKFPNWDLYYYNAQTRQIQKKGAF